MLPIQQQEKYTEASLWDNGVGDKVLRRMLVQDYKTKTTWHKEVTAILSAKWGGDNPPTLSGDHNHHKRSPYPS